MTYTPGIPNAGDFISGSQSQIKINFQQANTVFGEDHEDFTQATNAGTHKKVTTLDQAADENTTATENILYSYDNTANNAGLLQFSRGISDAQPTPVTTLQSPVAGFSLGTQTNSQVFDFSGMTYATAIFTGVAISASVSSSFFIAWDGTTLKSVIMGSNSNTFQTSISGSVLSVRNGSVSTPWTGTHWTLQFHRIGG